MKAVLFDLDGTLLDTAPDLAYALNQLRKEHGLNEMSLQEIRPYISYGARGMLQKTLDLTANDPRYSELREKFLLIYQDHLADTTQFFPEIETVLTTLDQRNILWGIVTNKFTHYTQLLLKALSFEHRPACVICGDTLTKNKPDPAPILHACELLQQSPSECLYIGDSLTDVSASKSAGIKCLVALYGYIGVDEDPLTWQADGYITHPSEILEWINGSPPSRG